MPITAAISIREASTRRLFGGVHSLEGSPTNSLLRASSASNSHDKGRVSTFLYGINFPTLTSRWKHLESQLALAQRAFALRRIPIATPVRAATRQKYQDDTSHGEDGDEIRAERAQRSDSWMVAYARAVARIRESAAPPPNDASPRVETQGRVSVEDDVATLRVGHGGLRVGLTGEVFPAGHKIRLQGQGVSSLPLEALLGAIEASDPTTGNPAQADGGHSLVRVSGSDADESLPWGNGAMDSSKAFAWPLDDLLPGDRVSVDRLVPSHGMPDAPRTWHTFVATVRHVAQRVPFAPGGPWIGVALDIPAGIHDGEVAGVRYFRCAPRHGVFVRSSVVRRLPEPLHSLSEELFVEAMALEGEKRRRYARRLENASHSRANVSTRVGASDARPSVGASSHLGQVHKLVFGNGTLFSPQHWTEKVGGNGQRAAHRGGAPTAMAPAPGNSGIGARSLVAAHETVVNRLLGRFDQVFRTHNNVPEGAPGVNVGAGLATLFSRLSAAAGDSVRNSPRGGGGAPKSDPRLSRERPRLGDIVQVIAPKDARQGQHAKVVQDDLDLQPFALRFVEDGEIGPHFYSESSVRLVRRGSRPSIGDEVVVLAASLHEMRLGERAIIVQDDQDNHPYRLQFKDLTFSGGFYRETEVQSVYLQGEHVHDGSTRPIATRQATSDLEALPALAPPPRATPMSRDFAACPYTHPTSSTSGDVGASTAPPNIVEGAILETHSSTPCLGCMLLGVREAIGCTTSADERVWLTSNGGGGVNLGGLSSSIFSQLAAPAIHGSWCVWK